MSEYVLKNDNGRLSLLYRNMKYELIEKQDDTNYWICFENGLRFIVAVKMKDDVAEASWSVNKVKKTDETPKVHSFTELSFENALMKLKEVSDSRHVAN